MEKIRTALISVSDKKGIEEFARGLHHLNVKIISTGGTARAIKSAGIPVMEVSAITGFEEMLGGRVKTLSPKIHGGILARRNNENDMEALKKNDITPIDMVVVNLYPFLDTIQSGATFSEAMEQIDIGGTTLIRAAAKNFPFVAVVCDPADYTAVLSEMDMNHGTISMLKRLELARKAFEHTAVYDSHICQYLIGTSWQAEQFKTPVETEHFPKVIYRILRKERDLRYGENPHQKAALYVDLLKHEKGWAAAEQLHGKELSYNNYVDMDAAWDLVTEFKECACVIVKHTNPCGTAIGENCMHAFTRALEADPDSAFGSIIAFNRRLSGICAKEIKKLFVEVVIAPDFEDEAIDILSRKKNLRIIKKPFATSDEVLLKVKNIEGAFLIQDSDLCMIDEKELKVVTVLEPSQKNMEDLIFAWKCVKHVKSNAIVLAADKKLIGVGAGQMSRVDSARIAVMKSRRPLYGAVMASDAFIPFRDTIDVVAKEGIKAIIQPGGSIRDDEVIAAANELSISMVFTGLRHFLH